MTSKEAIERLKATLEDYEREKCFPNAKVVAWVEEPFDLAINALEREEICKNIA